MKLRLGVLVFLRAVILVIGGVGAGPAGAFDYYVKANGTGSCTSWEDACSLQDALWFTVSEDRILVAQGVYKPTMVAADREATFQIPSGVVVAGGFPPTGNPGFADRNPVVYVTILSGDIDNNDLNGDGNNIAERAELIRGGNSYHVVKGATDVSVLDGFTITAGDSRDRGDAGDNGGGMYNNASSTRVWNVIFSGNAARKGGGMSNENGSVTELDNVSFVGNSVSTYQADFGWTYYAGEGGAIYNSYSNPILNDVYIHNNSALGYTHWLSGYHDAHGAGMHNYYSNPTLTNVTISGNWGGVASGMYNYASRPTVIGATISGNDHIGIFNVYSDPVLSNITISDNAGWGIQAKGDQCDLILRNATVTRNRGGGMYTGVDQQYDSSNPEIYNSIFWGNTGAQIDGDELGTTTISDSVVQGGCPGWWPFYDCTNVINADPLLGSLGNNGGFTETIPLQWGSSAINAGNATTCAAAPVSGVDQRGVARPQPASGACDIGAYEFLDQTPPVITAFSAPAAVNNIDIPITAFTATDAIPISYRITTTPTPPEVGDPAWSGTPPTYYPVFSAGAYTLYPWAKDAFGNVSALYGSPASVVVDLTLPKVTAFTVPDTSTRLAVPITTFTGWDDIGVAGYKITEYETPPDPGAEGWTATPPATYTVGSAGTYTLYPWVKDTAGNVSALFATPGSVYAYPLYVTVTSEADTGAGSLRQAIADVWTGGTIDFDPGLAGGTIRLSSTLTLLKKVTIDGSALAVPVTISGDTDGDGTGNVRAFWIEPAGTVALKGLSIVRGAASGDGGAIYNRGVLSVANCTFSNSSASGSGGAIFNSFNRLTVKDSTFSGNSAAPNGFGGGISNIGTATVTGSTFSGNAAKSGGGINNDDQLTLANSTFSGNPAAEKGGGIYSSGLTELWSNTFSGNSAAVGGGIYNVGILRYANTIVANSAAGGDCVNEGGTIEINTNNLVEDGSCSAALSGEPLLALLADRGGPTRTLALLPGSPAVDAGDDALCAAAPVNNVDQRGVARPQGAHCDIGAYEVVTSAALTVNSLADPGDGVCDNDACTLREAIAAVAEGDTIGFDAGLAGRTIRLDSALTISTNLAIDGSALVPPITISGDTDGIGGGNVGVFEVHSSATAALDGLIIADGFDGTSGAGIRNAGTLTVRHCTLSGNAAPTGGAVHNSGILVVAGSTLSGNTAGYGGGIYNSGTLSVIGSTFSANSASEEGGAIYGAAGAATAANSTFSGNSAKSGGGVYSGGSSLLIARSSTFSGNSASIGGGGIYNRGMLRYTNTIVANSTAGGDCVNDGGTIGTNTKNLVEDGSCSASLSGDPLLAPLGDNGGSTQTLALLPGSPALDAGDNGSCAAPPVNNQDQRGIVRPQGARCDIGAYEAVTAPTYTVNSFDDPGDGVCNGTECTLREAIDAVAVGDTIDFDSSLAGGTIRLGSTLVLSRHVAIDGSALASPITISGDTDGNGTGNVSVLKVNTGVTAALWGLVIDRGHAVTFGGGIRNEGTLTVTRCTLSSNSAYTGGGIYSNGTLTVIDSTLSGNSASYGGGIFNEGTLSVAGSTFSGNSAVEEGGGLYHYSGAITVTNSTFSGNSGKLGGGIFNRETLTVTNGAFSGNSANEGGGIYNYWYCTLNYANTLIANSTAGGDCANYGDIVTNTANLVEDGSCAASLSGDPSLGVLQDNGGPTATLALLGGSPAIDAGDNSVCPANDQRGEGRPHGARCDIGAYELIQPAPAGFGKSAPASGSAGQSSELTLDWGASTGAARYDYCIDESNDTVCDTGWVGMGDALSAALSGLAWDTTYYWQARGWNAGGVVEADGGVWWSFLTRPCYTLTATAGTGGSVNADPAPNCGGSKYRSGTEVQLTAVAEAGYVLGGWSGDGSGKVNPLLVTMDGDRSIRADFILLPLSFAKNAPSDGQTGTPTTTTLQWDGSSGSAGYEYCVDTNEGDSCDTGWVSAGSATSASLSLLEGGTAYYWQVRAVNAGGSREADGGVWWSFTTAACYTVTVTVDPPSAGSVDALTAPNCAGDKYHYGATPSFTVVPNPGYAASVGGTCGGTLQGTTYTTHPIVADCTVAASFQQITADLAVSIGDGTSVLLADANFAYTITATNLGPMPVVGAGVAASFPADLSIPAWSCSGTNGGVCGNAAGSGAPAETADLPVGGRVTYTVNAFLTTYTNQAVLTASASVTVPTGAADPNAGNNSASHGDRVVIAGDASGCDVNSVQIAYARYSGGPILCTADAIRAYGDVQVLNGGDLLYAAPMVRLQPGFRVIAGGRFYAGNAPGWALAERPAPDRTEAATAAGGQRVRGGFAIPVAPRRYAWDSLAAEVRQGMERLGIDPAAIGEIQSDLAGHRYVFSTAAGLLSSDQNGVSDVYLYDASTRRLDLVSRTRYGMAGNGPSDWPAIDAYAERILFQSQADDLVMDDANRGSDLFIDDLGGSLERLTDQGAGDARHPALDGLGTRLRYDLVEPGLPARIYEQLDLGSEATLATGEAEEPEVAYHSPAISPDGRFVAHLESGEGECRIHVAALASASTAHLACPAVEAGSGWTLRFDSWGEWIEIVDPQSGEAMGALSNPVR